MFTSIREYIDEHFYKVFNESHLLYTLIYLFSAFFIGFLSLFQFMGNFILFFATSISITFIILIFIAILPTASDILFSEEHIFDRKKGLFFAGVFLSCCLLLVIYFIFGKSSKITIEFLGWDVLLPTLFIIIFFGWNIAQIWFLKYYIEDIASKVEKRLLLRNMSIESKESIAKIFLVISLLIPIILHTFSIGYFYTKFSDATTEITILYVVIILLIFLIIAITSFKHISLFKSSLENDSPNVFSSVFYIFIWFYIWYRSFSFINAFSSATQTPTDILTALIDVFLMIAVAISVLRSLGGKVKGIQIFNQNNIAFFLYAFTLLYIEGQVLMITGAGTIKNIFTDSTQISMVNNFIILIIATVFYMYYSSYILQRKGFIIKIHFTSSEVISILSEYREYLVSQGYLELENMDKIEFETFLEQKNLRREEDKPDKGEVSATRPQDIGEGIEEKSERTDSDDDDDDEPDNSSEDEGRDSKAFFNIEGDN